MGITLHPHWHTTIDGENSQEPQHVRISGTGSPPSRKPAAAFAILLVLGTLGTFMYGVSSLRGQLTPPTTSIRITDNGLEPSVVTVFPGQDVTWINEQNVPHIMTSETLSTAKGPLHTPAIFPGTLFTTSIPFDASPATHIYYSLTSNTITGQIIIQEKQDKPPPPPPPPPPLTSTSQRENTLETVAAIATIEETQPLPSPPPILSPVTPSESPRSEEPPLYERSVSKNSIPENPNAVGTASRKRTYPPLANVGGKQQKVSKPFRQPETGMSVWLLPLLSVAFLLLSTRKYFRRYQELGVRR